jgi:hypothetical protein
VSSQESHVRKGGWVRPGAGPARQASGSLWLSVRASPWEEVRGLRAASVFAHRHFLLPLSLCIYRILPVAMASPHIYPRLTPSPLPKPLGHCTHLPIHSLIFPSANTAKQTLRPQKTQDSPCPPRVDTKKNLSDHTVAVVL